jgi:phosphopentomutase/2,3-bisphosphoglycerate-independent phosphoglycerate mutase family metalloenzyme
LGSKANAGKRHEQGIHLALLLAAVACVPPATTRSVGPSLTALRAPDATETEPDATPVCASDAAVVVVVLDGARWQEVFVGADPHLASTAGVDAISASTLLPHLYAALAERGAALGAPGRGATITASGPNFISLPGYTEIFTGRRTHACLDNECAWARTPTIADEVRSLATDAREVAVFASWDRIERAASNDPERIVVWAGRSHLWGADVISDDDVARDWLDRGAHADPRPGAGDFRPDRFTAALALRYLETKRPRFLFLGLGEPDEYAHRGDYAGYLASLRAADGVIGELFAVVDRMGARGQRTSVLITADHGRARDYRFHGRAFPESARVWLVAAGAGVAARGFAVASRSHRLADVAPTIRLLLGLPDDDGPSAGAPIDELLLLPAAPADRSVARL